MPSAPQAEFLQRLHRGREARLVQLERRQLLRHGGVQLGRRFPAPAAQPLRRFQIGFPRQFRLAGKPLQRVALILDQVEPPGHVFPEQRQLIDLDIMLAGDGAEREQPFLQLLQPARVQILVAGKRLKGRHRVGDFGQRAVERADHRLQPSSRLVDDPHQRPLGGVQPALGAAFAGQFGEGAVHRLHHLFPVHHDRAGFGKLFLFARRAGPTGPVRRRSGEDTPPPPAPGRSRPRPPCAQPRPAATRGKRLLPGPARFAARHRRPGRNGGSEG